MEMDDVARRDMELAAEVRDAAHALNLAILKAANAGLLVAIEVGEQELEGDSPAETWAAPSVLVIVEKA